MIAGRPLFLPARDTLSPPSDYFIHHDSESSLLHELQLMNQHLQGRVNDLQERMIALEEWVRQEQFSWSDGR